MSPWFCYCHPVKKVVLVAVGWAGASQWSKSASYSTYGIQECDWLSLSKLVSGSRAKYGFLFFMQPTTGFADARIYSLQKKSTENRWKSRHPRCSTLRGLSTICCFFNAFLPFSRNIVSIILHLAVNYLLFCSFNNVCFSGTWFTLEGLKW